MPIVAYYLGRPAHVWSAAVSRRNSARQACGGGGLAHSDVPRQPAAGVASIPTENVPSAAADAMSPGRRARLKLDNRRIA